MTNKGKVIIPLGIILGIGLAWMHLVDSKSPQSFGSVGVGSSYQATTSSTGRFTVPANLTSSTTAANGTLGSIVITGAAAGVINIYDATTTNINLRTGQTATSSILIASFPASTAAGTYTLDENFYTGLIYDVVGTMPTTTVTYRSN